MAAYVIKEAIANPAAATFAFPASKTMYGGKHIAPGDTAYLFASETQGGAHRLAGGLVARGTVTAATPLPTPPGHTPRVAVTVAATARPLRPLGRADLKPFTAWSDNQPQTELNFRFYRQATNKIGGISPATAAWLDGFFPAPLHAWHSAPY